MASNIFSDAKKLRKQHPNKKWADLVKMAAKQRKTGKPISGVKKKAAAKPAARKKTTTTVKRKTTTSVSGIGAMAARDLTKNMGAIQKCEKDILSLRDKMKGTKGSDRVQLGKQVAQQKKWLAGLKAQKTILKRSI